MPKQIQQPAQKSSTSGEPRYTPWRHGGWYVSNVRYPDGAAGCVSNNYPDGKWRIVCDPRRTGDLNEPGDITFPTRDAAALAEYALVQEMKKAQPQELEAAAA